MYVRIDVEERRPLSSYHLTAFICEPSSKMRFVPNLGTRKARDGGSAEPVRVRVRQATRTSRRRDVKKRMGRKSLMVHAD